MLRTGLAAAYALPAVALLGGCISERNDQATPTPTPPPTVPSPQRPAHAAMKVATCESRREARGLDCTQPVVAFDSAVGERGRWTWTGPAGTTGWKVETTLHRFLWDRGQCAPHRRHRDDPLPSVAERDRRSGEIAIRVRAQEPKKGTWSEWTAAGDAAVAGCSIAAVAPPDDDEADDLPAATTPATTGEDPQQAVSWMWRAGHGAWEGLTVHRRSNYIQSVEVDANSVCVLASFPISPPADAPPLDECAESMTLAERNGRRITVCTRTCSNPAAGLDDGVRIVHTATPTKAVSYTVEADDYINGVKPALAVALAVAPRRARRAAWEDTARIVRHRPVASLRAALRSLSGPDWADPCRRREGRTYFTWTPAPKGGGYRVAAAGETYAGSTRLISAYSSVACWPEDDPAFPLGSLGPLRPAQRLVVARESALADRGALYETDPHIRFEADSPPPEPPPPLIALTLQRGMDARPVPVEADDLAGRTWARLDRVCAALRGETAGLTWTGLPPAFRWMNFTVGHEVPRHCFDAWLSGRSRAGTATLLHKGATVLELPLR